MNAESNASSNSTPGSEVTRRILVGILIFVVLLLLSYMLPHAIPGQLAFSQLAAHPAPACEACPRTEQIIAAGLLVDEQGSYLTALFAAPPVNTNLTLTFSGSPVSYSLQRQPDGWHYLNLPAGGGPRLLSTNQRDRTVVFALPPELRLNGFAVSTLGGDRLPADGFLPLTYPAPPHFNFADIFVLLLLCAAAWFGYTRGILWEAADLLLLLLSIAISAILYRPLASAFATLGLNPLASAILASCLLVVALGLAGAFLVRRTLSSRKVQLPFSPAMGSVLGAIAGAARALPLLALAVSAGTGLDALSWASAALRGSILGSALIHVWTSIFSM